MKQYLDTLDFILRSPLQLNIAQMDLVWDAVIENSLSSAVKDYVYEWIRCGVRPRHVCYFLFLH